MTGMAPICIDLLSDSDNDASPNKAANDHLQGFNPRKEKAGLQRSVRRGSGVSDAIHPGSNGRPRDNNKKPNHNALEGVGEAKAISQTSSQRPVLQQRSNSNSQTAGPKKPRENYSLAAKLKEQAERARAELLARTNSGDTHSAASSVGSAAKSNGLNIIRSKESFAKARRRNTDVEKEISNGNGPTGTASRVVDAASASNAAIASVRAASNGKSDTDRPLEEHAISRPNVALEQQPRLAKRTGGQQQTERIKKFREFHAKEAARHHGDSRQQQQSVQPQPSSTAPHDAEGSLLASRNRDAANRSFSNSGTRSKESARQQEQPAQPLSTMIPSSEDRLPSSTAQDTIPAASTSDQRRLAPPTEREVQAMAERLYQSMSDDLRNKARAKLLITMPATQRATLQNVDPLRDYLIYKARKTFCANLIRRRDHSEVPAPNGAESSSGQLTTLGRDRGTAGGGSMGTQSKRRTPDSPAASENDTMAKRLRISSAETRVSLAPSDGVPQLEKSVSRDQSMPVKQPSPEPAIEPPHIATVIAQEQELSAAPPSRTAPEPLPEPVSDGDDTSDASEVPSRPRRGVVRKHPTATRPVADAAPGPTIVSMNREISAEHALQAREHAKPVRAMPSRLSQAAALPERSSIVSKHGVPYSLEEDALLAKLKEVDKLSWDEMVAHFNGRTKGSLQVRYSSKVSRRHTIGHSDAARLQTGQNNDTLASTEDDMPKRRKRVGRTEVAAVDGFVPWSAVNAALLDDDDGVDAEAVSTLKPTESDPLGGQDRTFPSSLSRLMRQRELGIGGSRGWSTRSKGVTDELQNHVLDTLDPKKYFEATSGDVDCVAWSPNGNHFAAGSIGTTDERSMQYNNERNLLIGDNEHNVVREMPEHHIPRPKVNADSGNVNSLHSMRESQDPRLFMTVAAVGFSPDGSKMFSAGKDSSVRAYDLASGVEKAECAYAIDHPAPLNLLSISSQGLLATACDQSRDGSIAVYRCAESGYGRLHAFSPSRLNQETALPIFPSALRWGTAAQHGNLLLAGFSADAMAEGRHNAGETCLWDAQTGQRVELNIVTRNIFDVAWNPAPSIASSAFAVASMPGTNKVNRGTRSVVQCFAPRQGGGARSLVQLECPAADINDVLYCPYDTNLVAAGATDGKAYVWDLRFASSKQSPLHVLGHSDSLIVLDHQRAREDVDTGVRFLLWGATSSRLYSGSSDGVLKAWNPYRATENAHVKDVATFTTAITSGAFSHDFRDLLIGEEKGRLSLLSMGCGGRPNRSARSFKWLAAPPLPRQSGLDVARSLLSSGEIELRPMGALPVMQAVQGPLYRGPYLKPTEQELAKAEHAYSRAQDEESQARIEAGMTSSQSSEAEDALRLAAKRVESAYAALLELRSKVEDADVLMPKAMAQQQGFAKAEKERLQLETSLSHAFEACRIDCNYLPAVGEDDGEAPDSRRSERRIPDALREAGRHHTQSSNFVVEEESDAVVHAGCSVCFELTPNPEKLPMPVCEVCTLRRNGFTGSCAKCSAPVRPAGGNDNQSLCERCDFYCFRCTKRAHVRSSGKKVTCKHCKLSWEINVLGYRLLDKGQVTGANIGPKAEQIDAPSIAGSMLTHYASRWHVPLVDT